MYKVVLIDDEPIILEGLATTIPWSDYDCRVVGTARDGKEGMEVIRRYRPDMVITDILMDNMDGLKMIAGVKAEFPGIRVTILTGYRNFDYAREAVKLDVDRLILKPSRTEEIEEAVRAMKAKLDETAERNDAMFHPLKDGQTAAAALTVRPALEYIDKNYHRKLYLSDVAENSYVSQWYLSKLLHRETGKSFPELLNSVRIEKARKLLEDPDLRIGDIADKVGFSDAAHFARAFRRETGMSANEYRKKIDLRTSQ